MKTLIAIPCMDMVPAMFSQSVLHMVMNSHDVGELAVTYHTGSLIYDARNLIALSAIEQDVDRILWLDSDMLFIPSTLRMLQKDMDDLHCDMVSGLYFRRSENTLPVIFRELDMPAVENNIPVKHINEYLDYPRNKIFPVKGCGFGCVLTTVKLIREVWDKFGAPFSPFEWAGEDMAFCYRVNQLGHTIYCDSRVSCGHIGQHIYTEQDYDKMIGGDK